MTFWGRRVAKRPPKGFILVDLGSILGPRKLMFLGMPPIDFAHRFHCFSVVCYQFLGTERRFAEGNLDPLRAAGRRLGSVWSLQG